MSIVKLIEDALARNQFLSGGAILMAFGALGALCRKVPAAIQDAITRRLVTTIDVSGRDQIFDWMQHWLAVQPFAARSGLLSAICRTADDAPRAGSATAIGSDRPEIAFVPAPGSHWFWYGRTLVHVVRDRNEEHNQRQGSWDFFEKMTVRIYSRDRSIPRRMFGEARDLALPPEEATATLWGVQYDDWGTIGSVPCRDPGSVILPEGMKEDLFAEADRFACSRAWYRERGIPYRWACLFYGPPGSGKSSLAAALAAHMRRDLALLSLAGDELTDGKLRRLMSGLPPRTVLLIEDIDRDMAGQVEGQVGEGKLTYAGVLNALDGVAATEGRVLIITTNRRETLDPTLLRPGRIDREFYLGDATPGQAHALFLRFFPGREEQADDFAERVAMDPRSMAALQGWLRVHHADPDAAACLPEGCHSELGTPATVAH